MEITIFDGKINCKWPFSIVFCMFTRGYQVTNPTNHGPSRYGRPRNAAARHHQQRVANRATRGSEDPNHQLRIGLQAVAGCEVQLVQGQGLQRVHGEQGEDQQTSDRPKKSEVRLAEKSDGVENRSCQNELILVIMRDAGVEIQSKQIAIGTTAAIFCMYVWKSQGQDKEISVGGQGLVWFLCP